MSWLIILGGIAGGALAGFGLMVVEFGAWFLISPRRPAESKAEADPLASSAEPIRARAADGVELVGRWLSAPRPSGKTMILVHGFMDGPAAMMADRASALLERGWSVAAIALRGHAPSGGRISSFGALEAADLRVWLNALADRLPPDETIVPAVWGRSMGAAVALRAAVEDSRIQALVLEAPLVDLEAVVASRLRKRWIPLAPLFARLILHRAGRLAGVSLRRPRPLDLAPRITIPAVVVHGQNDPVVPSNSAQALAVAFPTPAPFLEVANAGHADVAAVGGDRALESILSRFN